MCFLATEYVEGERLDRWAGDRAPDLDTSLDVAIQIAGAPEEAHSKGITHRDIKPAHIMITPRGQVKVPDFGLAQVRAPAGASEAQETAGRRPFSGATSIESIGHILHTRPEPIDRYTPPPRRRWSGS